MRNIRKWLVRRKNKKAENEELFMPHIRPVSYTHLDVYKRQTLFRMYEDE